ncbi:Glucose-6-phosphate isomerase [Mesoplasma sp. JKS002658]|uniref:glucose-6-phosphate isomerase n=1 Tax=Mesoplasma whartonense TaxID=2878854 RepID=UPI002022B461|nr:MULTISPECIES: glucose-6-phosphate isomerase [unclassified Mesoplasma]MCL8211480.1 Glucose-6-phosphate isomerase [Mesoplasma sp. JKS002664]MCL8211940.1 Glucose-6-phosphate isomerase [Mesoplasma sp. JKS002662]MCL8212975.1 Glucose-6-phosphate isomerase [Mesoplasma sp. JKS002661]MCL8213560.1 Glucose-6-phosphate isomerase [Mesoplasma sp. JKS002660]MCL8213955.1 Glucose-6-phosphate isomerase [Mesoplasma sp. JKS002658]
MINVDLSQTGLKALDQEIDVTKVKQIHEMIFKKTGAGADFLGWLDWPKTYDQKEYALMKEVSRTLAKKIDYLVVIGIGGSYLGTRAADEMIRGLHPVNGVNLIYAGNTISSTFTAQLKEFLKDKKYGICVVSKSGTTTEPGIAFRVFEQELVTQVGEQKAKELIIAVTDKSKGALKQLADNKGYQTFTIPDDIGGRFSVLTPVGIFPLMVAGINTDEIMQGALQALNDLTAPDLTNSAYQYAVARNLLLNQGYKTEALVNYEMQMQMVGEWWKQLFGESEGKDGKSLLPSAMIYSTDLHSLGQWVQEGSRGIMFETVIKIAQPNVDLKIPTDADNLDGLNYLKEKTFHEVNQTALTGVVDAHVNNGKMPNIILEFEKMDGFMFGYLVYWFERAVAMSGYLLGVNPFNQPGVEIYKHNMFKLLGKPGVK